MHDPAEKYIRERRRGARCYKLTMDSLESSVSTLSSLSLFSFLYSSFLPSDQFPSPADALHSLSYPSATSRFSRSPLAIPSAADTSYEVPERALPFSFPSRYSFECDTCICACVHECGRVRVHRSPPARRMPDNVSHIELGNYLRTCRLVRRFAVHI